MKERTGTRPGLENTVGHSSFRSVVFVEEDAPGSILALFFGGALMVRY